MSRRAVPALVMVLVGLVGLVIVGRDATEPPTPFFANTGGTWMPAVGESGSLTGSWFCPGIPTGDTSETADDGSDDGSADGEVGGEVVVSNSGSTEITGRYLILTDEGEVVDEPFSVPAFAQQRFDVGVRVADADFASVVVEIDGGGGFVEQVARHPLGDSVSACSTETSANWYLADGYTLDNSVETLVLTNPFDQPVVADLRFSTETSEAAPRQFDGFFVPPRSVETITIADYYGACGNETLVEPDATWYPLVTMRDLGGETFDASAYEPIPDPVAPQGLVRVADPGPGDDSGTLYVYADGISRFVSDSGTIRRWMTTVEQQYEFAC